MLRCMLAFLFIPVVRKLFPFSCYIDQHLYTFIFIYIQIEACFLYLHVYLNTNLDYSLHDG